MATRLLLMPRGRCILRHGGEHLKPRMRCTMLSSPFARLVQRRLRRARAWGHTTQSNFDFVSQTNRYLSEINDRLWTRIQVLEERLRHHQ